MEIDEKKCPYCAETIKASAKKCKFCGEWLEEKPKQNITNHPNSNGENVSNNASSNKKPSIFKGTLAGLLLTIILAEIYAVIMGGNLFVPEDMSESIAVIVTGTWAYWIALAYGKFASTGNWKSGLIVALLTLYGVMLGYSLSWWYYYDVDSAFKLAIQPVTIWDITMFDEDGGLSRIGFVFTGLSFLSGFYFGCRNNSLDDEIIEDVEIEPNVFKAFTYKARPLNIFVRFFMVFRGKSWRINTFSYDGDGVVTIELQNGDKHVCKLSELKVKWTEDKDEFKEYMLEYNGTKFHFREIADLLADGEWKNINKVMMACGDVSTHWTKKAIDILGKVKDKLG